MLDLSGFLFCEGRAFVDLALIWPTRSNAGPPA
jgi:hypothetical protein